MIARAAGDWRLTLRPDLGGAVAGLTHRGEPVLRPTPDDAQDVLRTACFPLAPYANRIAGAAFDWRGRRVRLLATTGFEPHAIHGVGWRAPWTVQAEGSDGITLGLHHAGDDDWPWAFTARQTFALDETGLSIELSMTNLAEDAAPAGLGLHPYFVRRPETRLRMTAPRVWLSDPALIPERLTEAAQLVDWSPGPRLADAPPIDHAYADWDGRAELIEPDRLVRLTASPNAAWVHGFTPAGEDYICVEPVTHRP
ncbi:MAG: aldose 1-epimerase, partial [Brevundimonas sp.]